MYEVPSMPDIEKVIITADTVNKKELPTYIRRENIDEPVKRPIQASGLAWGGKMLVVICSDIPVSDHVMESICERDRSSYWDTVCVGFGENPDS